MKQKGIIEIKPLEGWFCSLDFMGHNEGSGYPIESEDELQKELKILIDRRQGEYDLKIIDRRVKQIELVK